MSGEWTANVHSPLYLSCMPSLKPPAENFDDGSMACAVCKLVLTRDLYAGWSHGVGTESDHEPVPVPPDSVETVGFCDFCHALHPSRELRLPDGVKVELRSPDGTLAWGAMDTGRWAACEQCAFFIDAGRLKDLIRRAAVRIPSGHRHAAELLRVTSSIFAKLMRVGVLPTRPLS